MKLASFNFVRISVSWAVCIAFICVLSIWPAIYNGFPLLFPDSYGYIAGANKLTIGMPAAYAWLCGLAALAGPYGIVGFQAITSLFVVYAIIYSWTGEINNRAVLASVVILLLTRLPWLNSLVMPDIFGGLGPASAITLMIGRFDLPRPAMIGLLFVIFFSVLSQTASIAVVILALGTVAALSALLAANFRWKAAVAAWVVASAAVFAINYARYGVLSSNPGGAEILFAKYVEWGVAQKFLEQKCTSEVTPVCHYLPEVNRFEGGFQSFLWEEIKPNETLRDILKRDGVAAKDYENLNKKIITFLPFEVLALATKDSLALALTPGEKLRHRLSWGSPYPDQLERFKAARQQQGQLEQDSFNLVYRRIYLGSLVVLIAFAALARDKLLWVCALTCLSVVVANAFVHASLVCVCSRYQDKVSWYPLTILLSLLMSDRQRGAWDCRALSHNILGRVTNRFARLFVNWPKRSLSANWGHMRKFLSPAHYTLPAGGRWMGVPASSMGPGESFRVLSPHEP